MSGIFATVLVFLGEFFSIWAELIASKRADSIPGQYLPIFLSMFLLITLGGGFLIAGYMYGYLHLRNIWIITAISVGSILIVEPILALILFRQLPTVGAAVGLALGFLGIISAVALH